MDSATGTILSSAPAVRLVIKAMTDDPKEKPPAPPIPPDKPAKPPVEMPPDQPGVPEDDPDPLPKGDPPPNEPTRLVL